MEEQQNLEYKQSWKDEFLKWICRFALISCVNFKTHLLPF